MNSIGQSKSESIAAGEEDATILGNEVDGLPHLTELNENGLFALEVGLM